MSGEDVVNLLNTLAQIARPDPAELAKLFGTTFKTGPANPYWSTFEFTLTNGPFVRGDFRLSKDGQQAALNLETNLDSTLPVDDLDLAAWGPVVGLSPNPRIPPEGADAYIYKVNGVKVFVHRTHDSQKLHSVGLGWGADS
jgi:hypothetical protein